MLKPTTRAQVLVMGGSQGAAVLYDELLNLLTKNVELAEMDFNILLLVNKEDYETLFAVFDNVRIFKFLSLEEVASLYNISDIAITRGGATSLAEQQIFGIKKLIIPHPHT